MENNQNDTQQELINQMTADYGNNIAVRDQVIARFKVQTAQLTKQIQALTKENADLKAPKATKKAGK